MSAINLKICGVRSAQEARQLLGLAIDYAGLNFIPSSKRYISFDTAQSIMAELKTGDIKTVGLFAGRPVTEVNDYVRRLEFDYVQLHGDEPADYAKAINAKVIRAIAVKPGQSAKELIDFIDGFPADYFVLDRHRQGQGDPIDTGLAARVIAATPSKLFLAGGITPENLPGILNIVQPYGIDIAGGVRTRTDDLDIAKVARCLKIIKL